MPKESLDNSGIGCYYEINLGRMDCCWVSYNGYHVVFKLNIRVRLRYLQINFPVLTNERLFSLYSFLTPSSRRSGRLPAHRCVVGFEFLEAKNHHHFLHLFLSVSPYQVTALFTCMGSSRKPESHGNTRKHHSRASPHQERFGIFAKIFFNTTRSG